MSFFFVIFKHGLDCLVMGDPSSSLLLTQVFWKFQKSESSSANNIRVFHGVHAICTSISVTIAKKWVGYFDETN